MKLLFPIFSNGDYIFCLAAEDNGTSFFMMVDCHVFTLEVRAIVTDTPHCHIGYLVVTHIDVGHIDGTCNMLNQMPELKIGYIIYNSPLTEKEEGQQIEPPTNSEKEQTEKLEITVPKWKSRTEHTVAAKNVLMLSTLIQRNWKGTWNKNLMLTTSEYLTLGELGKMFIVPPTQVAIDELSKYILDRFVKKFHRRYPFEQGKERGAGLFELPSLLYDQRDLLLKDKISASIDTMRARYGKPDREDISKTNRASIAFVWELGNKEILLSGNASSEIAIEGIETYKKKSRISLNEKIYLDAIKVSRRGNNVNLSKELLKYINSPNWISYRYTSSTPHLRATVNIIYQPLLKTVRKRIMYFSSLYYKNDIYNKMGINVRILKKEGTKMDVEHINGITS